MIEKLMLYKKYKVFFCFLITVVAGLFILLPYLEFQPQLWQGDHGRDFYASVVSSQGGAPYRNYSWVYGPLMPYYYGLFVNIMGASFQSVLMGKMLLLLITGLFFCRILLYCNVHFIFSVLGSIWFLYFNPDFFYTYNHVGAMCLLFAALWTLIKYFRTSDARVLLGGLVCLFFMSLIKVNMGLSSLVAYIFSVFIFDFFIHKKRIIENKVFYGLAILIVPGLIFLTYYLFLKGIPSYVVRQALPYLDSDHPSKVVSFSKVLKVYYNMIVSGIMSRWVHALMAIILNVSIVSCLVSFFKKKNSGMINKKDAVILFAFCLFFVFNLHEFLMTSIFYRTYWVRPLGFLLMFFIIDRVLKNRHVVFKCLIAFVFLFFISQQVVLKNRYIDGIKKTPGYLAKGGGRIYTLNLPEWFYVVNKTTQYLRNQLGPEESFFALPYEPLYYYLLDKESPVRETILFEYMHIPKEQEQEIISNLEKKKVNYILISSRSQTKEQGLGIFGEDYGAVLKEYFDNHFQETVHFGPWDVNDHIRHGTKILKRMDPL